MVLASSPKGVPRSLLHHLKHNRVLHERLIIVSVIVTDEPHVAEAEHLRLVPVGEGIERLIIHIGFMDKPNVPGRHPARRRQPDFLPDVVPEEITYFVGRQTVIPTRSALAWRCGARCCLRR